MMNKPDPVFPNTTQIDTLTNSLKDSYERNRMLEEERQRIKDNEFMRKSAELMPKLREILEDESKDYGYRVGRAITLMERLDEE